MTGATREQGGTFGKPSAVEDRVAAWLDDHGVAYERQRRVWFRTVDFRVGEVLIEVYGCYWHACPEHHPATTKRAVKQRGRDRALASYCQTKGIPLVIIWEHAVNAGDFSALAGVVAGR